ncbi:proline-, glutamic acid- and leucine-rich protein 1-like [Pecten maximus]|uniref:proline-, glutamic acid- and leucine-rich protein 1-like n=1 Tax=Pecten maximus TaxID=6579 RepID=UPI001458043C|nr:proline-, glutamic acid- and leucine-rich protein 1-like [Pecten maximus]
MADSMIENVFFSFVPSFCGGSASKSGLKQLVDIAEDNKLFSLQKPGKLHEIIGHINTCLNSTKQRLEGLLLLDKVLEQCVTGVFTQNALTWIRFMIQIFQSHDPPSIQRLACHVCGKILGIVSDFTSLSREVTSLVPQIISALLLAPTEWRNEACLCINSCILNYPGPCATFKGKIDTFVVKELSTDLVSKEVVRCFALLSRCGGGGNMGLKHTEGWSVQLNRVVNGLHTVLDLLYEQLDTVAPPRKEEDGSRALPLGEVPISYPDRYHSLVSRYHAYCSCLQALLSESFPALVKVPSQAILNLICRILSVNCKTLTSRPSTQQLLLAGFIPSIHKVAISLLQSLIKCCKRHLLPHTKLVLTLLVQELIWSHATPNYGQTGPYSELRKTVYSCLTQWFQVSYTFVETTTEDSALCEEILHDAGMQFDTLKLSSGAGDGTSKSDSQPPPRKKKKIGYQEISQGISSQRKIDRLAGADLVTTALEALYWWLTALGPQLSHKLLQSIQEFAISTCLAMFQKKKNSEIPYSDPCCRHQVLRVLLACCMIPHPSTPSPLHCSLGIFRMGLQDQSCMVNKFCLEAQRVLEVLIHPRAPCMKAPVVVTQVLAVGSSKDNQTGQRSDTEMDVNSHHDKSLDTLHPTKQQTDSQKTASSHQQTSLFLHSVNHVETGDSGSSSLFSRKTNNNISSNLQKESIVSKTTIPERSSSTFRSPSDEMEASTSGQGYTIQDSVMMEEDDESSKSELYTEMEVNVDNSTPVVEVGIDNRTSVVEVGVESSTSVVEVGANSRTSVVEDDTETGVKECTSDTKKEKDTAVPDPTGDSHDTIVFKDIRENCDRKEEGKKEDQADTELVSMLSSFVNTATDSGDDQNQ